jgi:sec-independent protein translocase protein TatB
LVIFGDRLPQAAAQLGRALRQIRQLADSAKAELREGLGPEFKDVDLGDLNPKTFVRKHLLDDHDDDTQATGTPHRPTHEEAAVQEPSAAAAHGGSGAAERAPFDDEAT